MPINTGVLSPSEKERLCALYTYDILDTPVEKSFDNLARLAAQVFNIPIVLITFLDKDRQWVKSSIGADVKELSREQSFCEYTIQGDTVFEVRDALLDYRFVNHPSVSSAPHIRYYAGAPLIDDHGYALGTICLFDLFPRELNDSQKDILKSIAGEVVVHLLLRRKDEQIRSSVSRCQELLDITGVSPEIHCILDHRGKVLFVNEAVTRLLGYTVPEAMELGLLDVCYPEDIPGVLKSIEQGLQNKDKELHIDFRVIGRDEVVRWISWSLVSKNRRWYTYGRDITANKKVESDLMKLSFVASKVNNAVVINDADNHVTWVNAAFEKITGFSLEDVRGKRLGDMIIGPNTDLELIDEVRRLTKQRQSFTIDMLAYRKDKKEIWISVYNTVVLDERGNVDLEVEIIIDITDKKRAEEELQVLSMVASKTNTGVNIQDNEGITTWVNQSLEKLTGYRKEELYGHHLGNILSPNFYDQELISTSRDKSKNNQSYTIEVLAEKKDGSTVWLSVSNTPIINSKGKVERQIDLISDITQRKQVEKEMIEAKEQALKLSEAKEMFLSVMSHEIRTPLNAVIGMTHLLLDNDPKISQIDDLNILKFSGENLLHIINDILDFTKMETGKMELEVFPFNLKTLANDIINSLQVNVKKKGNQLNLVFDPLIPTMISGDKNRLYQVLMNFLGNAIKFTENGQVQLKLTLTGETEEHSIIRFEIVDNGIGIPKDKQNYIFETFTQAKTDISRKYGGTGLGLAITKKLLQMFNSDIIVDSTEGEGTTFSFEIAFSKTAELSASPGNNTEMSVFVGKKILVVDDNEINILIAKRILSKWGLEIESAVNGYEAIEKIMTESYDLIFMDIKMAGIDGFETTGIIRDISGAYYKNVPIIALTASTLKNDHYKFKECGMNGHVLKPFNPEEIKRLLSGFLSKEK
ncbi:PAS domain S-box-containing protein [Pedobacter cryoconitis]|uniref:PAS domain S-box protein n=1 Tax=Pedobacter cryoconitis TaxID=188932 RepID=UPI00161A0752|nr:PAS domain S-box protein [Pedobacter cryoconitis]MBB6271505.1 PAS domain S-box-containing protein [Pedobacter cryoconitis]